MKLWSPFALIGMLAGMASAEDVAEKPSQWSSERVERKLEETILEKVDIEFMTLADAVDHVRELAEKAVGDGEQLRIAYARESGHEQRLRVKIKMENAKLGDVLGALSMQANRGIFVHPDGVVLDTPLFINGWFGMPTRIYEVPRDFSFHAGFAPDDDPFAVVDSERPRAVIEILKGEGITFPDGASAIYEPIHSLVVVQNTQTNIELFEVFVESLWKDRPPSRIDLRCEVYQVDRLLARKLGRLALRGSDVVRLLELVEAAREAGEAKLIGSPSVETRSGQRAKVDAGQKIRYIKGVVHEGGRDRFEFDWLTTGLSLEVDPVVGADRVTIEVNLALFVPRGEVSIWKHKLLLSTTGEVIEVEVPAVDAARLVTSTTVLSGQTRFLGELPGDPAGEKVVVAFLSASALPIRYERPIPE